MTRSVAPEQDEVGSHLERFLAMLDAAFRRYGSPDGLPERFRDAVRATPRHVFVHRFRIGDGPLRTQSDASVREDRGAHSSEELTDIYSDAVMTHVDGLGNKLPSTNSQPSYVLWLLHMLDLRPGQRVLEVGSGSGWLAAVMAHLVGVTGQVTGVEIIPELAAQSRADLARLGIDNVHVLTGDGTDGRGQGAQFERVMITAACWKLPEILFDQVTPGGRVLVPIELRGGGCQVSVLRREEGGFMAERAVPGWFVPLLGPGQDRPLIRFPLGSLPFWEEVGGIPSYRAALPLAAGWDGSGGSSVAAFRAFLGRVEPGFVIFDTGGLSDSQPWLSTEPFGIVDEADRSVALWSNGELLGYGGPGAIGSIARAYGSWAACGLPGLAGLGLRIAQADAHPAEGEIIGMERRGSTVLIWLKPTDAERWKELARTTTIADRTRHS